MVAQGCDGMELPHRKARIDRSTPCMQVRGVRWDGDATYSRCGDTSQHKAEQQRQAASPVTEV